MHLGVWLKQLKLASPNDKEGLVGMTPLHFAVLAQRVTAQGAHGAVRDRGPPWPLLGCQQRRAQHLSTHGTTNRHYRHQSGDQRSQGPRKN